MHSKLCGHTLFWCGIYVDVGDHRTSALVRPCLMLDQLYISMIEVQDGVLAI